MPDQPQSGAAHASLVHSVTDWYHGFVDRLTRAHEFDQLSSQEMSRLAGDIGVSSEELVRLSQLPTSAADLLEKRLAILGVAPEDIRAVTPQLLADLQRTCSHCAAKGRCTRDMESHPGDPVWKSYCPNSQTISDLL